MAFGLSGDLVKGIVGVGIGFAFGYVVVSNLAGYYYRRKELTKIAEELKIVEETITE